MSNQQNSAELILDKSPRSHHASCRDKNEGKKFQYWSDEQNNRIYAVTHCICLFLAKPMQTEDRKAQHVVSLLCYQAFNTFGLCFWWRATRKRTPRGELQQNDERWGVWDTMGEHCLNVIPRVASEGRLVLRRKTHRWVCGVTLVCGGRADTR